ncbi:MAG: beta-ketoacyl-ACP synthase II [Myxococcota bacterium]|nr:beta-ketoacyl-ACP synthase II [Myxococcota bacterium]
MQANRDSQRIVVTGVGCVTPLGMDVTSTWEAAVSGRSGVADISRFDASELPVRFAAEVKSEPDLGDLSPKETRRFDRFVRFALAAASEAIGDSKLEINDANRERIGVAIGSGIGGLETLTSNHTTLLERGARRVSPFTIPMSIGNMASGYVSIVHGLRGANLCYVSACASGAHSIGESAHAIRRGDADVIIAGGAEAPIVDIGVAGFAAMRALSVRNDDPQRACRPFDSGRDGFVMGEGAGVVVLESLAHARARGATVRAELLGYGASADGLHMAAPDESGEGMSRCMQLALDDSGLPPSEVHHINAHATSTPSGDPAEVAALRRVFGRSLDSIPVSATKSMTGHLLGAAGAIEAILSLCAMETCTLPPTINLEDVDPACDIDHVACVARSAEARVTLSNSFGFGGTNSSLLLGLLD